MNWFDFSPLGSTIILELYNLLVITIIRSLYYFKIIVEKGIWLATAW